MGHMGSIKKNNMCVCGDIFIAYLVPRIPQTSCVVSGDFLRGLFISSAFFCPPPFCPILKMDVACSYTQPSLFTSEGISNW